MYKANEIANVVTRDGEQLLILSIDSNTLPGVTVDTYSSFTGDGVEEQLLEDVDGEYDDYNWEYDSAAVLHGLALASIAEVRKQTAADGIFEAIEFESTWSPKEYNFRTDSYRATYVVNYAKLRTWAAAAKFDPEAYAALHHASRDGFASWVPGYLEDSATREGTILWLTIAAYIRDTLDTEAYMFALLSEADELWSAHTTFTLRG